MQNDATTSISVADMKKIISLSNHEAEVIDFSKLITEAAAPEKKEDNKKPQKGGKDAKKEELKQDVH